MQKYLIGGFILAIAAVVFALQNAITVPITLWFWKFEASLALIVMVSLLIGALLGILFSFTGGKKKSKEPFQENDDKPLV